MSSLMKDSAHRDLAVTNPFTKLPSIEVTLRLRPEGDLNVCECHLH